MCYKVWQDNGVCTVGIESVLKRKNSITPPC